MRFAPHPIVILLALSLPLAIQAGPQTATNSLDLEMLDMNGAPFRSFHLGLYAEGLDARHPAAAAPLPSEDMQHNPPSVQEDPERYTGVDANQADAVPAKPDIAPLLQSYDQDLLQPAATY
jgi:hypothetical protein